MRIFPALKLMVTRIGTLGTILLLSGIIVLPAVVTLPHGGVHLPGVPGGGPAGPVRGQGPARPAP